MAAEKVEEWPYSLLATYSTHCLTCTPLVDEVAAALRETGPAGRLSKTACGARAEASAVCRCKYRDLRKPRILCSAA